MSYKQDVEEIIDFINNYLDTEASDLNEISREYAKAVVSGSYGGRRISIDMADTFSYEFAIRSETIDIIRKSLINSLEENFLKTENSA